MYRQLKAEAFQLLVLFMITKPRGGVHGSVTHVARVLVVRYIGIHRAHMWTLMPTPRSRRANPVGIQTPATIEVTIFP